MLDLMISTVCFGHHHVPARRFFKGGDPLLIRPKGGRPPLYPPSSKRPIAAFRSNTELDTDLHRLRITLARFPKPGAWFLRTVRRLRSGRYGVGLGPDLRRGLLSPGQGILMDFRREAAWTRWPFSVRVVFQDVGCPGQLSSFVRVPQAQAVYAVATGCSRHNQDESVDCSPQLILLLQMK